MQTDLIKKIIIISLCICFSLSIEARNREFNSYRYQKNFDELTQAEHTKAKRTAATADIRPLIACADPGNMPMSNMKEEGYDNQIIKLLAESMGTTVSFFWRPYLERGLNRETFDNKECDLLLGMPHGYNQLLTTDPIYRSTYVFAYREDKNYKIESLDEPILSDLTIGTYQHSGLREALSRYGHTNNIEVHVIRQDTDLVPETQQWRQVQKVADGNLDIAGVWGPFAGYVKTVKKEPLVIQPVNMMEDKTPLEFSLSIGMREKDVILKYALDLAIEKNAEKIEEILKGFGVPLVSCSDCFIQGDIPSHGSYYERFLAEAKSRYLEPIEEDLKTLDESKASADQVVTEERIENWLEEGADVNDELANAVLAGDPKRIKFVLDHGANINHINAQGYGLLHEAARYRDSETLQLLLDLGANPDIQDINGWTPLIHAAYRNHVPSIEILVNKNANLELTTKNNYTALAIALGERKFWATRALVEAGANVNALIGDKNMTPLMIAAIHHKSKDREKNIIEGTEPIDIAKLLLEHGAKIDAQTTHGETPVMFAAAHDNSPIIAFLVENGADLLIKSNSGETALDVAKENRSDGAIKSLELFMSLNKTKSKT